MRKVPSSEFVAVELARLSKACLGLRQNHQYLT